MKATDALKLTPGQTINHRRYGKCEVRQVLNDCVIVRPTTPEGLQALAHDAGASIPDLLEEARNLSL